MLLLIAGVTGGGLLSWAQSLPNQSWTLYGDFYDSSAPWFPTPELALDYYFAHTERTAPYTQECKRYYSYWYTQGAKASARRENGAWVFDCNLEFVSSAQDGAFGAALIGTPKSCSTTSTNSQCFALYTNATPKNVGESGCAGSVSCGNPINPATGNKFQKEVDFDVPGSPWLSFVRYYNSSSLAAQGQALGPKWRHSFDYRVSKTSTGLTKLLRPDGSVKTFSSGLASDAEEHGVLDYRLDAGADVVGWRYDTSTGQVELYDISGRLERIEFKKGGYVALAYVAGSNTLASVTDHFGRTLTFAYTGTQLTQVSTPSGALYQFGYAANGLLVSVNQAGMSTRQYLYDEASMDAATSSIGQLTGIIDEVGSRFSTFKYDIRERAWSTEHAGGVEKFTIAYSDTGPSAVTTPLGAAQALTFISSLDVQRLSASTTQCQSAGCTAPSSTEATYDAHGNQTSWVGSNGLKSCIGYDQVDNLPWRVVAGLAPGADCASALSAPPGTPAVTTSFEWNQQLRAPQRVAGPTVLALFTYDAAGRVASTSSQATNGAGSGAEGFSVGVVGAARTAAFTYNAAGQVLTVDGPRTDIADITAYAYDTAGNLATVTNPAGQVTSFANYDGDGRARSIVFPNGTALSRMFDARGHLTSQVLDGLTSTYSYDTRGLLSTQTEPTGATLTYGYDAAHRLVSVTDQHGGMQQLALNSVGSATQDRVLAAGGTVVTQLAQTFDQLNRVLSKTGAHVVSPTAVLLQP